ncbi:MAG: hypothetical protein ACJ8F7_12315 [Gemmataceae bacterium]
MRTRSFLALALLGGLGLVPAHAGLIPSVVTATPDGANFRFTYAVVLPSDYRLKSGDFFTIYDFQGYVGGGTNAQPANWTFGIGTTGPNPPHISAPDNPGVVNLTWSYNGPTLVGQQGLGNFSALSQFQNRTDGFFASRDYSQAEGHVVGNITTTDVPGRSGDIQQTPEPATVALLAAALPALGLLRLLRTRNR